MSGKPILRLGALPRTDSVRLAFNCSATLKAELDRYATLHSQTHGQAVEATELIPHMLNAFMARDRGFCRLRKTAATEGQAKLEAKEKSVLNSDR